MGKIGIWYMIGKRKRAIAKRMAASGKEMVMVKMEIKMATMKW